MLPKLIGAGHTRLFKVESGGELVVKSLKVPREILLSENNLVLILIMVLDLQNGIHGKHNGQVVQLALEDGLKEVLEVVLQSEELLIQLLQRLQINLEVVLDHL